MDRKFGDAIVLRNSGQAGKAARLLETTLGKYPDLAPVLWYLGGIYLHDLGQAHKALPCFRRAVELAPKSERASLGLFHSLWGLGMQAEGLEEVSRFQTLTNFRCADYRDIVKELGKKWQGLHVGLPQ